MWSLALLGAGIVLLLFRKSPVHEGKDASTPVPPHEFPADKKRQETSVIGMNQLPVPYQYIRGSNEAPLWKKAVEVILAVSSAGLLLVNLFLMYSTKKSADMAERAFNLDKQHIEDTDEAVVKMSCELEPYSDTAVLLLRNTGKVTAHRVTAHFEIWRHELPSNKQIALLRTFDVSQDELAVAPAQIGRRILVPGVSKTDWEKMDKTQEGISFSVTIQYKNGFDSLRNPSDCKEMITTPPYPNDNPALLRRNTVECDDVPGFFEAENRVRERIAKTMNQ